jgi:hypothetical protein
LSMTSLMSWPRDFGMTFLQGWNDWLTMRMLSAWYSVNRTVRLSNTFQLVVYFSAHVETVQNHTIPKFSIDCFKGRSNLLLMIREHIILHQVSKGGLNPYLCYIRCCITINGNSRILKWRYCTI